MLASKACASAHGDAGEDRKDRSRTIWLANGNVTEPRTEPLRTLTDLRRHSGICGFPLRNIPVPFDFATPYAIEVTIPRVVVRA